MVVPVALVNVNLNYAVTHFPHQNRTPLLRPPSYIFFNFAAFYVRDGEPFPDISYVPFRV